MILKYNEFLKLNESEETSFLYDVMQVLMDNDEFEKYQKLPGSWPLYSGYKDIPLELLSKQYNIDTDKLKKLDGFTHYWFKVKIDGEYFSITYNTNIYPRSKEAAIRNARNTLEDKNN